MYLSLFHSYSQSVFERQKRCPAQKEEHFWVMLHLVEFLRPAKYDDVHGTCSVLEDQDLVSQGLNFNFERHGKALWWLMVRITLLKVRA